MGMYVVDDDADKDDDDNDNCGFEFFMFDFFSRLNRNLYIIRMLFTPPRYHGGVLFLLQFVCVSVCVSVCLSVCPALFL